MLHFSGPENNCSCGVHSSKYGIRISQLLLPLNLPSFPLAFLHAVWSIGKHGPTLELVDKLRPLLFKYRVSAYLCGHDHSMQHLREVNTTLDYFLVGAGHLSESSQHHEVHGVTGTHTSLPTCHPLPSPCRRMCPSIPCCTGMVEVISLRSMVPLLLSVLTSSHSMPHTTLAKVGGAEWTDCYEKSGSCEYSCHANPLFHRQIAVLNSKHPSTAEESQVILGQRRLNCF